jgi:hypothetical protein
MLRAQAVSGRTAGLRHAGILARQAEEQELVAALGPSLAATRARLAMANATPLLPPVRGRARRADAPTSRRQQQRQRQQPATKRRAAAQREQREQRTAARVEPSWHLSPPATPPWKL